MMEEEVPSGLFDPSFPTMGTDSEPFAVMATAPEKLFPVFEIVSDPVPEVFCKPPLTPLSVAETDAFA